MFCLNWRCLLNTVHIVLIMKAYIVSLQGVQRRMIFVVMFFVFFIFYFGIVVAIFDIVYDVEQYPPFLNF